MGFSGKYEIFTSGSGGTRVLKVKLVKCLLGNKGETNDKNAYIK